MFEKVNITSMFLKQNNVSRTKHKNSKHIILENTAANNRSTSKLLNCAESQ